MEVARAGAGEGNVSHRDRERRGAPAAGNSTTGSPAAGAADLPPPALREALAQRFLAALLVASLAVFTGVTLIELTLDYRHEVAGVAAGLDALQRQAQSRLDRPLREGDASAIRHELAGLLQLPAVSYVQLVTGAGAQYEAGRPVQPWRDRRQRIVKLAPADGEGRRQLLGTLHVEASTSAVKRRLFDRFLLRLGLLVLAALLLSAFLLRLFDTLVSRHLGAIAAQMRRTNAINLREPLLLERAPADDEINQLLNAFRQLRRNLLHEIELREAGDRALAAENRLNLLSLDALPQALLRLTPEGRVSWANAAAERLCGRRQEAMQGKLLAELLPAVRGSGDTSAEALCLQARARSGLQEQRVVLAGADGASGRDAVATALRDADGELAGMLLLLAEEAADAGAP